MASAADRQENRPERGLHSDEDYRTLEERCQQLFELGTVGIVLSDSLGSILHGNPAMRKLLGYSQEETRSGQLNWQQITPPQFAPADAAAMEQLVATGRCEAYEKEVFTKAGRRVPVLVHASRLQTVGGEIEIATFVLDLTELHRNSWRAAFLVRLDDSMRLLNDPDEILQVAIHQLGEYLKVDRCGYCEVEPDGESLQVLCDYTKPGVPSLVGRYSLSDFAPETAEAMRQNRVEAVANAESVSMRAHVTVPLHKNGKLVAAVGVHHLAPREWLPEEIDLVCLAANRCWESIERARMTRAWKASESRLSVAQRAGRIGSFEWLVKTNQISWSPELESLYGVPEGTFEGGLEDWTKRVAAEDAERVTAEMRDCWVKRISDYAYEFRAILPSNELRWLRGQAQFFYDEAGEVVRMVGVNIDIEAQKQAEAHRKQQWQAFDTAISNTPDFIYTFDLEGRFTYANRSLLLLLNRSLEEMRGKTFHELDYPKELADRLSRQVQDVIETRQPVRDSTPFAGATGEMRHYEYLFAPVLDAQGNVESVTGSTRDITERLQAEEQEREGEEQMRESARLEGLGVMAGGIAHDFNNLLTGILGNACLLADGFDDANGSIARQIVLAAERAADLTRQMLAFSGKGRFVTEQVDLNTLVHENLTLLRASLSRSVTVDLELRAGACPVEGDRSQLQQIVMNLLINASEAMGEKPGRVAIRTAVTERVVTQFSPYLQLGVEPGRYAVLEVRDNGSGMTPETLRRIFDPFFTTKFTGRGLGLAAVLGIVKGHKGDIEVITQYGAGTTFRILLPASEQEERPQTMPESVETPLQRAQTVLVVDDEDIVKKVAETALRRQGLRVLLASNGAEALEMLENDPRIALVILDLTMPVMTGEQAIPLIRAIRPGIPIILSSGYSEAEIAQRFSSAGISAFLQKPYRVSAIVGKVTEVLAQLPESA